MADAIVIPLGKDAKLYYAAPGAAAPNTIIAGVSELTVTLEKDEAEVTRRISGGWEDHREGIKRLSLSFTLMGVTLDTSGTEVTAFNVLQSTFFTGIFSGSGDTGIALHACAAIDALTSTLNGAGPLADFLITRFERSENLGDAQSYSVECRMTQTQGRSVSYAAAPE